MKKSDDTKSEQETILRFDADKGLVNVYTAWPPVVRKMTRKGYTPSQVSTIQGKPRGWFYRIPFKEFRWSVGAIKNLGNLASLGLRPAAKGPTGAPQA